MLDFASSFALGLVGLLLYFGGFVLVVYVFFRGAKRVGQHMDRVEMELVTLNRQIAELMNRAAR